MFCCKLFVFDLFSWKWLNWSWNFLSQSKMLFMLHPLNSIFRRLPQFVQFGNFFILFVLKAVIFLKNILEKVTYVITLLLLIFFVLVNIKLVVFIKSIEKLLILFLLINPEKLLIKLIENFKHSSSLLVLPTLISHSNCWINRLHDKFNIVSFFSKVQSFYFLAKLIFLNPKL